MIYLPLAEPPDTTAVSLSTTGPRQRPCYLNTAVPNITNRRCQIRHRTVAGCMPRPPHPLTLSGTDYQ